MGLDGIRPSKARDSCVVMMLLGRENDNIVIGQPLLLEVWQ